MPTKVFINLPVKDLEASKNFYNGLGFSFNPQFTDEKAGCLVISDNIYVMLLVEDYFKSFTKKPINDARLSSGVLIALDANSQEEVKALVEKAVAEGGRLFAEPQDYGWMYNHGFEDLDGHQWEIVYMDHTKMPN